MRVFGIDPGSTRTGYGCVDTDGTRHTLVICGALTPPANGTFAGRLHVIHDGLTRLLRETAPSCVVVESLFYARNVRSALQLGHARGVVLLAAEQCGLPVVEYSPAEIKVAVVGYGRADKGQVQQMVKLLLRLPDVPTPHDAADALAAALCHVHSGTSALAAKATRALPKSQRSWRDYRPPILARRQAP